MNNFITRTITGTVFIAIIIGSILADKYVFAGLFLLFTILGIHEFYRLIESNNIKPQKLAGIIEGVLIYAVIFGYLPSVLTFLQLMLCIGFSIILLFSIFIFELFRKKENPFLNIAATFLGVLYIALPFGILNIFYNLTHLDAKYPEILLMFFFIIWTYDTGAYLTGKYLGRHKLFERISPKKTWEGLIGGMILSLGLTVILSRYFIFYSSLEWSIFACVTIAGSTFGDLSESLLKRSVNIKDSGTIFPGHGGLLDRFDSVLLAAPFCLIYIIINSFLK